MDFTNPQDIPTDTLDDSTHTIIATSWDSADFIPPQIPLDAVTGRSSSHLQVAQDITMFDSPPTNNNDPYSDDEGEDEDDEDKLESAFWANLRSTTRSATSALELSDQINMELEVQSVLSALNAGALARERNANAMLQYGYGMAILAAGYDLSNQSPDLNVPLALRPRQRRRRRHGTTVRLEISPAAEHFSNDPPATTSPTSSCSSAGTYLPSPTSPSLPPPPPPYATFLSTLPTSLSDFLSHLDNEHSQAAIFEACFQTRLDHIRELALDSDGVLVGCEGMKTDIEALENAVETLKWVAPIGR
ncbi:hypothetical protein DFJ77DRAFT_513415 [Powellomyces hirtus]|nr:hypothetical protein DFJ77DRAFT_513415 [Powellomyces hirtus]